MSHKRGRPGTRRNPKKAADPKGSRRDRGDARDASGPRPKHPARASRARTNAADTARAPFPVAGKRGQPARKGARSQDDSPRVDPEKLQQALRVPPAPLRVGEWLWTTREGAERDLIEELLISGPDIQPRLLAPALVASAHPPRLREGRLDLTFARQGFEVAGLARHDDVHALAAELRPSLHETIGDREGHALHVFVPDSTLGNELSGRAQALRTGLEQTLQPSVGDAREPLDDVQLRREGGLIAQVCVCDEATAAVGGISSQQALSLWPGGRARMRLGGSFPSRAARKLAEAFAWLGMAPGSGELCVDLGAAPGGWSWLVLEKRARVIAVDPARMDPKLMRNPRLRHVQGNAFDYQPEEPVDWLFCDMAYRPLEVAQMLARWARRRDTRLLVANFKLPMKRKVEMIQRIRSLLTDSGFTSVRTRQLYHDREEITLTAHVR